MPRYSDELARNATPPSMGHVALCEVIFIQYFHPIDTQYWKVCLEVKDQAGALAGVRTCAA